MTSKRWSAKRDANEPEIVSVLEALGCAVERQEPGGGKPDLRVTEPRKSRVILIEVKMPGAKLNAKQKDYHARSAETIHIVRSIREAINLISYYWGLDEEVRV